MQASTMELFLKVKQKLTKEINEAQNEKFEKQSKKLAEINKKFRDLKKKSKLTKSNLHSSLS